MYYSLKYLFICLLFNGIVFSQYKYWEEFTDNEKDSILKRQSVIFTDFLYEIHLPSDDSLTFGVLDIISGSDDFDPLYFYLYNKILIKADGALAEAIPEYTFRIFGKDVKRVVNYLTRDRNDPDSRKLYLLYGRNLGWSFVYGVDNKIFSIGDYNKYKLHLILVCKYEYNDFVETIRLLIEEMDKSFYNK